MKPPSLNFNLLTFILVKPSSVLLLYLPPEDPYIHTTAVPA
ncbi:uncharacterized protein An09g02670 [Aspergillus niger]|uniref:Contig An09c0070, genomic contig n=2 Tax=Aspergillus niger TaxID=5061 RepID=A2QTM8_ASPNC|nr:uncharacterized protein An09g02670 [Aspergillus niger]CAK40203.1 unnamed protein product [Aspergillus niger]